MRLLDLSELRQDLPGITRTWAASYEEAAVVAFEKNKHSSGVQLKVSGDFEMTFQVTWKELSSQEILRNWKNTKDTAELGAVGIAILLVKTLTNFTTFELAESKTGIDFWLGTGQLATSQLSFWQREARLEISGIFRETPSNTLSARVKVKKEQMKQSDKSGLPGYVIVVEFGKPKSKFTSK